MLNYIIPLTPNSEASANIMGGKGANLVRLMDAGFTVPGGCVLTTELFRKSQTAQEDEINTHLT